VGAAVKVLVAIHYSVLVARNGYTRNAVAYRVACQKWHVQWPFEPGNYCRSH